MNWWIIAEYESVDVSTVEEGEGSSFVPGEPWTAKVVQADGETDAIRVVAMAEGSGFYQAVELPSRYRPRRVEVEVGPAEPVS